MDVWVESCIQTIAFDHSYMKNGHFRRNVLFCSGGRIRTSDLRVMSPTSCLCSTPHRVKISVNENFSLSKSPAKIIILFLCKVKIQEKFSL